MTSERLASSRWRGQPRRLEVWYTSITDPGTGTGFWFHHELVAPSDGRAAFAHGWMAAFRPGRPPLLERFGPHAWERPESGFVAGRVRHVGGRLTGSAGNSSWDLAAVNEAAPLATFPLWAWRSELLPAAQVVSDPASVFAGVVRMGDEELRLVGAKGASARIYGHGNASRWGWLHADLGGGDLCEVVTAVSNRTGLRLLPPLALVRLRLDGVDLPADPLLAALRLRTRLSREGWTVRGRLGRRLLEIDVRLPPEETLDVTYVEPDGGELVCRNSERAHASVRLSVRNGARWLVEREWVLAGTAHAEVGGDLGPGTGR